MEHSGISKGINEGLDQKAELIMALVSVRSRQSPSLTLTVNEMHAL